MCGFGRGLNYLGDSWWLAGNSGLLPKVALYLQEWRWIGSLSKNLSSRAEAVDVSCIYVHGELFFASLVHDRKHMIS